MDMMLEQFKTIFDRPEKVKKLRETILNLAVRGKLVPQDPNDEPASVLLERIREDKERLIKEKKIKKEKSLAEISEDEIEYFIPENWKWCRITNVYSVYGNSSFKIKTNELEENGRFPVVSQGKELIVGYSNQVDKVVKLEGNSVVIFGDHTKEVKLVDFDFICGADGVKVLLPICCNIKYFYWFLKNVKIDSRDYGRNFKRLNEKLIPIPPLEEQKRIVEKVDSMMIFCDRLEKALEKKVHYGELSAKSVFNAVGNVSSTEELEETLKFILLNFKDLSLGDNAVKELKNCILQLAVQGKLVPQDPNDEPAEILLEKIREEKERLIKEKKIKREKPLAEIGEEEKPFELPKGWEWVRLLDANIDIGDVDHRMPKEVESGIPYISPRDFYGKNEIAFNSAKKISMDDYMTLSKKSKPEVSDIIFPRYGTIGVIRFVEEEKLFLVSYSCATIKTYKNNVTPNYIRYYLESNIVKDEITKYVNKTTQPNVGVKSIKNFICPIPPLEEQKRIVQKVDSLMNLCDQLEKKIENQKDCSNRLMESIIKEV